MRTVTFLFLALFFLSGCESDDVRNRNPFLFDANFNIQISNIQALDLEFPGTAIFTNNGGVRGVFVVNTGGGLLAWEASDPNHAPNECSTMQINGTNVTCQCDDANTYNLFTGQSSGENLPFTMLSYRVTETGGSIRVSN